jgi:hypothetical protein
MKWRRGVLLSGISNCATLTRRTLVIRPNAAYHAAGVDISETIL